MSRLDSEAEGIKTCFLQLLQKEAAAAGAQSSNDIYLTYNVAAASAASAADAGLFSGTAFSDLDRGIGI